MWKADKIELTKNREEDFRYSWIAVAYRAMDRLDPDGSRSAYERAYNIPSKKLEYESSEESKKLYWDAVDKGEADEIEF